MTEVYLGKIKGKKSVFSNGQKSNTILDIDLYFDPDRCVTYAVANNEIIGSVECSTDIITELSIQGIKVDSENLDLPAVTDIWIPSLVDETLNELKRLAGRSVAHIEYGLFNSITVRAVRQVNEREFHEYVYMFTEGDKFAIEKRSKYFINKRNILGKEYTTITKITWIKVIDFF
mgnify:CR=1 FL=1